MKQTRERKYVSSNHYGFVREEAESEVRKGNLVHASCDCIGHTRANMFEKEFHRHMQELGCEVIETNEWGTDYWGFK